jgi:hypothetical protein
MKRKKPARKKQKRTDEKRLIAYIATAGVTLAFAAPADAGIIYTPADITVNNNNFIIDINGDGTDEFEFWASTSANSTSNFTSTTYGATSGSSTSSYYAAAGINARPNAYWLKGSLPDPANVPEGSLIPPFTSALWNNGDGILFSTSSGSQYNGNFDPENTGYLGVRFNPGTGDLFGWIHVDSVAEDYTSFHINGWAFEDDEEFILAGDTGYLYENDAGAPVPTPEPSTLALLAMGASGVLAVRRRKKL